MNDDHGHAFRIAIDRLRESLQHAADNNASDRYIAIQNATIRALVDYYNQAETIIQQLQEENHQLAVQSAQQKLSYQEQREILEGICLLHGIYDLHNWLNSGHKFTLSEAIHYIHNGMAQLPLAFREMIDAMNEGEKQSFYELLNNAQSRLYKGGKSLTKQTGHD